VQPEQHSQPGIVRLLLRARRTVRDGLTAVAPGRRAWWGAGLGMALAITAFLAVSGLAFASRRGPLIDVLTALVVGWLLIAVIGGALLLIGRLLGLVPPPIRALGLAAVVLLGFLIRIAGPWAFLVTALVLMLAALVGAGTLSLARSGGQRRLHRGIAAGGLIIGLAGMVLGGAWLLEGEAVADSGHSTTGALPVRTLTYGSGVHAWRSEFADAVAIRTPTVDGRPFLASWDGLGGSMRTDFWGFGPEALPLNATVWYPDADGPFPLVLIVHGNARMELPSDTGYAWLGEELASRGYVAASVDQNFLNGSITRFDVGGEYDARAWLLLEHLRLWREWQDDPSSPLHGVADLDRVALIGHSRGGEAVATAAYFDQMQRYPEDASVTFDAGVGIRSVIALSPSDSNYQPAGRPTTLIDTNYLVIQGGMDADHFAFLGMRQYHRTHLTDDRFGVRAAVFLPDANHGQFNTEWGRWDAIGPGRLLLDAKAIMAPAEQRSAGRAAIVAFLDATLRDDLGALALLREAGHPDWPPGVRPMLRYSDSSELTIAGFDEDADPDTGTLPGTRLEGHGLAVWREEPAPLRLGEQGSNVVALGWSLTEEADAPMFRIQLPDGWPVPPGSVLVLSLADTGRSPAGLDASAGEQIDLSVELTDAAGGAFRVALSDFGGLPAARVMRLVKSPLPGWAEPFEPVASDYRIPLESTVEFDGTQLHEVRLVFDRTPAGLIHLDNVSIAAGQP
jgi:dienelactone hydrolase